MKGLIKAIFFLVVGVGIVVYFLGKAPDFFKSLPREQTSTAAPSSLSAPISLSAPGTSLSPVILQAPTYSGTQTVPTSSIPAGFSRNQLSPYFDKIRISSAYASYFSSSPSQMQLYFYLSGSDNIDVTGWKIRSNKQEIRIPQAANLYDLSGLALDSDIVLSGNGSVSIYSNTSAVNRNLRLNKCIGYLQNDYKFNPSLPQNCPSLPHSQIAYLSGQCQSYVFSLGGCQLPSVSFYNLLPGNDDGNNCRAFLDTIGYISCVKDHRFDSDFFANDWRIWANQNILDPQHDRILLFDKQGLLVDEYTY